MNKKRFSLLIYKISKWIALVLIAFLVLRIGLSSKEISKYPISLVPLEDVSVTSDFWVPRLEINRRVSLPYVLNKAMEKGNVNNTIVYKCLEGAAYMLINQMDPELRKKMDLLINDIIFEWEDRLLKENPDKTLWDQRLYSIGHFLEAAVAYHRATGHQAVLDLGVRLADQLNNIYGPGKRMYAPNHQEIEVGLIKLFEITGEIQYLKLAEFFLNQRGRKDSLVSHGKYAQDHLPVTEQSKAVGHAVRATYMYTAMADIAAYAGHQGFLRAGDRIWWDTVEYKTFLTGGIGSIRFHEKFGDPYQLPNLNCWCETCAAIGYALWNARLYRLYGESRYIDMLERLIYNGILVGVSLSGNRFFYQNVLKSLGNYDRFAWINVPCCPPNVVRFLPQLGEYIYAQDLNNIYVNLFVDSRAEIRLESGDIEIIQKTRYPWEGRILLKVEPEHPLPCGLKIRIPGWTGNHPLPGGLYRYQSRLSSPISLNVNGKQYPFKLEKGYAVIRRLWKKGDQVEMVLEMSVRKVLAHENIQDNQGRVALEYGPLVYCAESTDNHGSVLDLLIPENVKFTSEYRPDFLSGIKVITGNVKRVKKTPLKGNPKIQSHSLTAIPYYAWSNRGKSEMAVWMAQEISQVRLDPVLPSIISKVEASGTIPKQDTGYNDQNDSISAVYDRFDPINSLDESNAYLRLRPQKGKSVWIEYKFSEPARIYGSKVYWVDDQRFCCLPDSWRILYHSDNGWQPVKALNSYQINENQYNLLWCQPVTTKAVRLEIIPQEIHYQAGEIGPPAALFIEKDIIWRECGVIEWQVIVVNE